MRRLIWLVFLAACTVFLATACGGGGGSSSDGNTNPQNITPTPTPTPGALTDILTDEEAAQLSAQERQEANTLSGAELTQRGLAQLSAEEILKTKVYFKLAAHYFGNQTSNDADTARFFYGLSQVLALAYDSGSDTQRTVRAAAVGYDGDLLDFGDLLDAFNYPTGPVGETEDPRAPENLDVELFPSLLPGNSPSGAQLQAFLDDVVMTDLEGALDALQSVATTFNATWTDPYSGTATESDYGDVLAARAALKAAMAAIMILNAQNLDIDIDNEDLIEYHDDLLDQDEQANSIQTFLLRNPEFFTPIADSILMQSAKSTLIDASADLLSAMDFIATETDSQADDWINLIDSTPEEIAEAKSLITAARTSLNEGTDFTIDHDTELSSDDTVINPAPFFSGLNFRSLLPAFVGDAPQSFPDPALGGVIVRYEGSDPSIFNEDIDGFGTPDILEDCPELYIWYGSNSFVIHWDGSDDAIQYCVSKSVEPITNSEEALSNLIACTPDTSYFDEEFVAGGTYFYRVCAVPGSFPEKHLLFSNEVTVTMSE